MTEKLTTIKLPNRSAWPTDGLIQVGEPSPTALGTVQDVHLDGSKIGRIECIAPKSHPASADDQPTQQWRQYPGADQTTYGTRLAAIGAVLRDHVGH